MKRFEFTVSGRPKGKGRPRMTKTGHVYTPPETKRYESEIRQAFLRQGGESFGGAPVMVEVEALFPMPVSWTKKDRAERDGTYCENKPDLDNITKVALDALNSVAWTDDKTVAVLIAQKRWTSEAGGVKVTITDLTV